MAAKVSVTWRPRGPLPESCDVVVVGSGLGGLMSAAKLASHGLSVCVLESHALPGGYAHTFRRKGYLFDVSLHHIGGLIGDDEDTRNYLSDVGVFQKLDWVARETLMTVDFADERIVVPNHGRATYEGLAARFPAERERLGQFLRELAHLRNALTSTRPDQAQLELKRKFRAQTWSDIISPYIRDPKLAAIFGQMWMYAGLSPQLGSANYWIKVIASFFIDGSSHVGGGGLASVFCDRIEELGGGVYTNRSVREIIYDEGRVRGVVTAKGERVLAPLVISNAHPYLTYLELLPEIATSKAFRFRLQQQSRSVSAYVNFFGLDCAPSAIDIPDGNYFRVHDVDMEGAYARCAAHEIDHTDWSLTSYEKVEDKAGDESRSAPTSKVQRGTVSICEVTPGEGWHDLSDADYRTRKASVQARLLAKYRDTFPGLAEHCVVHEFGTPRTMTRYTGNRDGAIYGFSQLPKQSNTLRLANRSPVPGLYLASAWVQPGGGYEGAMLAGLATAEQIMAEESVQLRDRDAVEREALARRAQRKTPKAPRRSPSKPPVARPEPRVQPLSAQIQRTIHHQDTDATGFGYNVAYAQMLADARARALELAAVDEPALGLSLEPVSLQLRFKDATRLGERVECSARATKIEAGELHWDETIARDGQAIVWSRSRLGRFRSDGTRDASPLDLGPKTQARLCTEPPARAWPPVSQNVRREFERRALDLRPADLDHARKFTALGLLRCMERARYTALARVIGQHFESIVLSGHSRIYQLELSIERRPSVTVGTQLSHVAATGEVSTHRCTFLQSIVDSDRHTWARLQCDLLYVDSQNVLQPLPESFRTRFADPLAQLQSQQSILRI